MSTIAHYLNKGHSLKELESFTNEELMFMHLAIEKDTNLILTKVLKNCF